MVIRFDGGTFVLINSLNFDGMTGKPATIDVDLKIDVEFRSHFLFIRTFHSHCSHYELSPEF